MLAYKNDKTSSRLIMLLYAWLLIPVITEAVKILAVFPSPCHSHQAVFRTLTQELARIGHEVTVITPFPAFPDKPMKNLKEISNLNTIKKIINLDLAKDVRNAKDTVSQLTIHLMSFNKISEEFIENDIMDFVNNNDRFDLIFVEASARLPLIFSHIYKVPLIQISSFGGILNTFETVGAPSHPFLYPLGYGQKFSNLTMLDKAESIYQRYTLLAKMNYMERKEDELVQKYLGKDFPSISELKKNVDMVFLNLHPMWDSNRPVPPNVVYLGRLHLQKGKELPKSLQIQLDAAYEGAIYMSFGSTIRPQMFREKKLKIFLDVLSKLPQTVFFKWDADIEVPKNVLVRAWFPQADLLRHRNIKLFITQGGLQSIDEAIDAEVPMIGVPMLWDQWYNVDRMVYHRLGIMCDIDSVDEDTFGTAVQTVLTNNSYRENVKIYKQIVNDQPQTSLERAIWWTEYVIRHKGAKHLRSPAFDMNVTDYYEIHFVLSVVAVIVTSFLALNLILFLCLKFVLFIINFGKIKAE